MAESLSLFGIVVRIALLLSGRGFGVLTAGGTLKAGRARPAVRGAPTEGSRASVGSGGINPRLRARRALGLPPSLEPQRATVQIQSRLLRREPRVDLAR